MGNPSSISSSFELFRRLARRLGVPARHAEDVAQDALLRGLEADQRIAPGGDLAAYRITIAMNQAHDHVRTARRRGEVLTSFDESEVRAEYPNPEDVLRGRQRHALVRRLIDRLDPKYRDLVRKHDLDEVPLARIAAELGLTTEAVKTQHRRALEELKAEQRRWIAEEHGRGRDGDACVPVAFGLYRRESWLATLRRLVFRILVQGALVILTGALVSGASHSLEAWLLPAAARAPGSAPATQEVAPTREGSASAAAESAAPAAREGALPAHRDRAGALAAVDSRPAASAEPPPPGAVPGGVVRRNAAPGSAVPPAISERERRLIRDARRALDAHNALADLEARQLLEMHKQEFPQGWLALERERLLSQLR
ncbi:RNA polymerase sigma factor [Sorangium cellulosum]|uniref:RNA polymerase sigma factor n=1 Tax=Sorangium cellulosum TaxID=56 RepID=A0A2L0F312_SORCE|nr:sigma-70 family RNA polymerase sigma factor [Sorangium cellulosum]AUX45891.1 RNA polymerase sigma factor [Sorangium cellulosum]